MKATSARNRTLIVGTGPFVRELLQEIALRPNCGYVVVGLVATESQVNDPSCNPPVLGSIENLQHVIQAARPDVIIVACPHTRATQSDHHLLEARVCRNIRVEQAEVVFEKITGKLPIHALAPSALIYSDGFEQSRLTLLSTRLLSLCFALVGLIVFAPLLLVIALLIKLDSPGPVLFIQERVGFGGKPFKLMKFRTMTPSEKRTSEWESDNIHRITAVGRWLRKYRLDELPQFVNILKGDMNLVGPRPHPSCSLEFFVLVSRNTPECGTQIPFYSLRYGVLPGITGWAQVRYQYANSVTEEMEKLRFDLYYIKHYSLWFDIRILFETVRIVLMGSGSNSTAPGKSMPTVSWDSP
jgi:exopolysaccharide biosynthesis polyprenyl glycosylphosphotransferase